MSVAKIRPVGSPVPDVADTSPRFDFPWSRHYETVFLNSGTAALAIAAKLCRTICKPDSASPQIILPAYGCPDLIAALTVYDIQPVLVDVSRNLPWMTPGAVERAITENTVAILAVGFLGASDCLEELRETADRAGVLLIEDSAQVMPAASSDNPIADFCVLSFGRGKPINLMGGGALLIRRDHLDASSSIVSELDQSDLKFGARWRLRRQVFNLLLLPLFFGILERIPLLGIGETVFKPLSRVYRLNKLEGLLARGYEEFLNRPIRENQYIETFGYLEDRGWSFPITPKDRCAVSRHLLRFPLLAPSEAIRNRALLELNRCGIGASAFYERSLPSIEGVRGLIDAGPEDLPNAMDFAARLLTLPIHEGVAQADIEVMATVLFRVTDNQ